MGRYSVETKLSPEKAVERAEAYFGEGGLELEAVRQDPCCVSLEGGGGYVTVTASREEEERMTTVELETREWDAPVRNFMRQLR